MKSGATSSLFFYASENSLWVLSFYETKQNLNLNLFQSTSEYQKRQLTNFLTFEWSKATDHVWPLGQFKSRPADVPSMPRVLHLFSFPPSIPLFTAGWAGPWRPIDLLHTTVHLLWKKRKFQKLPQAPNGLIMQKKNQLPKPELKHSSLIPVWRCAHSPTIPPQTPVWKILYNCLDTNVYRDTIWEDLKCSNSKIFPQWLRENFNYKRKTINILKIINEKKCHN